MLANLPYSLSQSGALDRDVQVPSTFKDELIGFVADQLPLWRDRNERIAETSETALTSQLCAHLNSVARHSDGWDVLQFRVEEQDEIKGGRKVDLVAAPCGVALIIEGRRHVDFDSILPIECKRLPTPVGKERDEREYVFSKYKSTGGVQRFKAGHHGAAHNRGAMIGYIQEDTRSNWFNRMTGWINELDSKEPGWTAKDLLQHDRSDDTLRVTFCRSLHERAGGLPPIELRHLWLEMN